MENYYLDERVLLALKKSSELMDILTFVKEVEFEIKDNLGFDVLWDSITGKQWVLVVPLLLEWFGYTSVELDNKKNFIKLLESNEIEDRRVDNRDN